MDKLTRSQVALRRKWTRALRSGRYRQGKNVLLNSVGGFCCLGVLCEVAGISRAVGKDGYYYYEGFTAHLPYGVADRVGLSSHSGHLGGDIPPLAVLNDSRNFTFDEIADVIDLDTLMRQDGAL